MIGETAMPRTRLVKLPGRGTTRVWEWAGPRGAQTLMLIHGVTFTAELNRAKVFRAARASSPCRGRGSAWPWRRDPRRLAVPA